MNTGVLSILSGAVVLGTAGVFVKTLDMPATVMACFRVLIPAVCVLALRIDLGIKLVRNPNPTLLLASTFTAIRIFFWVLGFLYAAISKAIIILYTWPIILAIFGRLFLKEEVTARTKVLLVTAFVGILIIYTGEPLSLKNRDLIGMGLMLLVAILNAAVYIVFKRALDSRSAQEVVLYDNLVGVAVFLPFLVYHSSDLTISSIGMGALYGFTIGLVGYVLLYYGLSKVKASVASVLCYMEVLSAIFFGVIIFNEQLTWRLVLGGLLILTSAARVRTERA